jgi:Transposase DDE domain
MKNSYYKRSWNQYNKNLINRGSITFWISDDSIKKWNAGKKKKHFGRPFLYSDAAILTAHTIRYVYNLPLRALEGFLNSLFSILKVDIDSPCYTQICRRAKGIFLPLQLKNRRRVTDIVFDTSGLKVYGEGEWKVRTHGTTKRRKWRKIHLGICPETQEILLSELTDNNGSDIDVTIKLLKNTTLQINNVYGDGLYDAERIYKTLWELGAKPLIPLKKNVIYKQPSKPWLKYRDDQIDIIKGFGGDEIARSLWKKLTGYHRRSLVETAFSRWKKILGSSLRSRNMVNQTFESKIKCKILNKMRQAS